MVRLGPTRPPRTVGDMTESRIAQTAPVEPEEVRHVEVAASTITAGDTIRHLDMWFKVRSVMTLNGDACIALVTASTESRVVVQLPGDARVMTWITP